MISKDTGGINMERLDNKYDSRERNGVNITVNVRKETAAADRLPINFTDRVMEGIGREAERRERLEERKMYWMIAAGAVLLAGGLMYALHVFGFLGRFAAWVRGIDLSGFRLRLSIPEDGNGMLWVMVAVNAMVLMGIFAYFTARASRHHYR